MSGDNFHKTEIRVRYKDTDRMGVVYYGNYLTFFEVARTDFMRHLGFPYSAVEAEGYNLVVIEANARYHANVGYDSVVTVMSKISQVKRARVRFDYKVFDENNSLLVTGYTVHACTNSSQKPARLPPKLIKAIEERS